MKVRIKKCPTGTSIPKGNQGLMIEDDNYEMLSPDTLMLKGKKHKDGGTLVSFNGTTVEAEAGEPLSIDESGNAVIWGNLSLPNSNKKFKQIAKEIGKEEAKYNKQLDKGVELVNSNNPYDGFEIFSFNSGKVLTDAALIKDREISQRKELLSQLQNGILEAAEQTGKSPEKVVKSFQKGGTLKKYKEGGDIDQQSLLALRNALAKQESSGSYTAYPKDPKTGKPISSAYGKYQFIEGTRKSYYNKYFKDKYPTFEAFDLAFKGSPAVQEQVMDVHLRDLSNKFGGDPTYIALAHRLGENAAEQIRNKGYYTDGSGRRIDLNTPIGSSQRPTDRETPGQYLRKLGLNPTREGVSPVAFTTNYEYNAPEQVIDSSIRQPEQPLEMIPFSYELPTRREVPQVNPVDINNEQVVNQVQPIRPITTRLGIQDFIGELAALTDRPDYVPGQSFEPQLYQPYQVSFQDRINRNNATFRTVSQQLTNNPEALSVLAAQKYEADNQVLAEEFRTNQAIANQVTNQNTELLNQAELQNIQLRDLQQQRQAQAKGITEDRKMQALASISNKVNQNRALNNSLRLYENFSNFKMDESGQLQYAGVDPQSLLSFGTTGMSNNDPYQRTMTTRDAQGNVRNTRDFTPSEIDKQLQFWQLQKQRRSGLVN